MDIIKQINHIIKWVGMEKLLEGMIRYTNELITFSPREKYLVMLRDDLNIVLKNYKNRYKDVD